MSSTGIKILSLSANPTGRGALIEKRIRTCGRRFPTIYVIGIDALFAVNHNNSNNNNNVYYYFVRTRHILHIQCIYNRTAPRDRYLASRRCCIIAINLNPIKTRRHYTQSGLINPTGI